MGTRGYFGFYYKGKYYMVYNHFDSYWERLGKNVIAELKELLNTIGYDELCKQVEGLKLIDNDIEPTDEEINRLRKFSDLTVSTQNIHEWYCLLRKCQGSLKNVLESGYVESNELEFEEYTYVVDLDNQFVKSYGCSVDDISEKFDSSYDDGEREMIIIFDSLMEIEKVLIKGIN
jgi:hypothetical protein